MYMWMSKQMRKNKKGFTLIELIVVIAILAILAAIAIPRLAGFTAKAQISADKATLATLNSAVAIGVADGTITDDVTVLVDDKGVITPPAGLVIETGAAFKLAANTNDLKWTVVGGAITDAPTIDNDTGVITP